MSRKLAQTTVNKFKKKLLAEQKQLEDLLKRHQEERERIRLSEASAERSPDPTSADGGSMAFELEKELTLDENTKHLLTQIEHALVLIKKKKYGNFESVFGSGESNDDSLSKAVLELESAGSIEYARSRAMHHHSMAHECLDKLPVSPAVEVLRELTDFQLIRIS